MVMNMANIAITIKYEVVYGLLIGIFTLTLSHSKGQDLHISTASIIKMMTGRANITIAMKYEVAYTGCHQHI